MLTKLRNALVAALAVGLVWVAAPALSTQRFVPGAVDFEQPLGALTPVGGPVAAKRSLAHRPGRGPVSYRSPVISAPKRFELAGLAGELRPLELRARERDGEWSPWTEAEDGSPVYFGSVDELQLRARGWRPRGTLHYVNVSGDATPAGGLLTDAREAINSAFISTSNLLAPAAQAAPTKPAIITRSAWGANLPRGGCQPREAPEYGSVGAAVVHHTVSANDYTPEEAPGIVLGICRYHRNANEWNDIGYNALVDRYGTIYQGRAGGIRKPVIGAHAQGFNAQTTGVAMIGTHTTEPITPAARRGLVNYLAWKLAVHRLPARGKTVLTSAGGDASRYPEGRRVRLNRVIGHRDVGLTACPGEALGVELARIRIRVQKLIDAAPGPAPPIPPEPTDPAPPPVEDDDGGGAEVPR